MSDIDTDAPASGEEAAPARRKPHPALMGVGMSLGLGVILVLLLMVFIMPSLESGPHDLRVGLVGAPDAVAGFEQALDNAVPGAYEAQRFDSEDDLRAAIVDRDVVGGFVVGDSTVNTLVASAGSATISGSLTGTAQAVGRALGDEVTVEDVVPLPADDPTGIGIGGLAFPLVFGGIVPVVAFRKVFERNNVAYFTSLVGFSILGGIVVSSVLTFVFGSIEGALWPVAGAMALGIGAMALPLAGLQNMFGAKGFTLGAMVMMFLGNLLAGIASTSAWLPNGLGTFGQILPPGSTGTLVRAVAYFDGAGGAGAATILTAWIVVGVVLFVLGARRSAAAAPEAEKEPALTH